VTSVFLLEGPLLTLYAGVDQMQLKRWNFNFVHTQHSTSILTAQACPRHGVLCSQAASLQRVRCH